MEYPIYDKNKNLIGEVQVTTLKDGVMVQCQKPTNVVGEDGYLVDTDFGTISLVNVLKLLNHWNSVNLVPNRVNDIHYIYTLHRPAISKGYGSELNTSHLHK